MFDIPLTTAEMDLRGELTRAIAELGFAPTNERLAVRLNLTVPEVEDALQRLHDAHALQLHPHACVPWAVHPFALSPESCWVEVGDRGWWANYLYCGMGIAAALGENAAIHTRVGGEREPLVLEVRDGDITSKNLLFHLSTPVRRWWDNVIYACASFQPFHSEEDIKSWCERHAMPRGAVVPMDAMWRFASDWYGGYLKKPWRKRSAEDVAAILRHQGFEGQFWQVA